MSTTAITNIRSRLKLVRIAGNPTAERQAIASRVTITSVLPALEQLDDLLLPGRKVTSNAKTLSYTLFNTLSNTSVYTHMHADNRFEGGSFHRFDRRHHHHLLLVRLTT